MKKYSVVTYETGYAVMYNGRVVVSTIPRKSDADAVATDLNSHLLEASEPRDLINPDDLVLLISDVYRHADTQELSAVDGCVLDLLMNHFPHRSIAEIRAAMRSAGLPEEKEIPC
jgi:hypothetical protein